MSASRESETKNSEEKDTPIVVSINGYKKKIKNVLSEAVKGISKPTRFHLKLRYASIPKEKEALQALIDFASHPLVLIEKAGFYQNNICEADPECLFFNVLFSRNDILDFGLYEQLSVDIKIIDILFGQIKKNSSVNNLSFGMVFRYTNPEHSIQACKLLGNLLETRQSLTQLSLSSMDFTSDSILHLALGLKQNKGLKKLSLWHNKIEDKGIQSIIEMLNDNPAQQLQQLELYNNNIGPVGAKALANFLKNPLCQLQWLNLKNNHIGDEGFKAIAESFEKNKSLEILNIWDNKISGNEGALALAKALTVNNSLAYFHSYANEIGIQGMLAIIDSLKFNQTLRYICFYTEHLDEVSAGNMKSSLAQVLRTSNRSLSYFESSEGSFSEESKSELATLIKANEKRNTCADYNWRRIAPLVASALTGNALKYSIFALIPEIMAFANYSKTPQDYVDALDSLELVEDGTGIPKVDLDRFSHSRFFCSETNSTFFARPEASTPRIEPMEYHDEIENSRLM